MASLEITSRTVNVLLLTGAILLGACATRPQVELADVDSTDAVTTTITSDAVPDPANPTSQPVRPDENDPTSTSRVPVTVETGLLAGGVDPETLSTSPAGDVLVQPTPAVLQNRRLQEVSLLPPPTSDDYEFAIQPLVGEPLERSTWNALCPVAPEDLRYMTVSFWGFDGAHHTGELIVAADQAEQTAAVFEQLHAIRFPIEQMRVVTPTDVFARRTGDGNNTASYVCRTVTGGTRFSEHALGLAIDVNPFQNPYQRGDEVIPALASSYLDRSNIRPGMIVAGDPAGDVVIAAFAAAGWAWGGDWNSLKDYQHFARNNR